ncbi:SDR family oxidoreductase [Sphingobium fluviale]|uniref:SDR family oxidoreductase n=1 Tax=Sphingobium fluviale TaxID=2506423 RepID=A0A4Q1KFV2_9SPHN|nr:SDR family oxidoreductase [Sphingobium fluviale]RXR27682.1 SDR family oxidoreductase [Sphingobium fluviale]
MDLGLKGKNAIVCAASSGIGRACATMLAREGANIVINGRTADTLDETAAEIRALAPDVTIKTVVGSVVDQSVREALAAAFPQIDILLNNAGGPPPGDFHNWTRDDWIAAVDQNMLSAIELIRLTIDGMAERGFGRIVNITSSAVRVPIPVIGMSNATRAGLTNFVFGLVPQYSSKGVTINNLLPGPFDTGRLRNSKEITMHLTKNPVAGRVGDPEEMGAMCAFLCSHYAGYINGQNILMDGGLYPGSY